MKNNKSIFWCKNCVMPSTRPRIFFDQNRYCNACLWSLKKKKIDWKKRIYTLKKLLSTYKSERDFNCLVPVSGGKDGSYVAYNLKHKYKMRPLAVTATPPLQLETGLKNIKNFVNSGYDLLGVDANMKAMQKINKSGFIEVGFPYFGWLIAIHTVVLRVAVKFKINLIFYGEDGEVEYGGNPQNIETPLYDYKYMKKIYLENFYERVMAKAKLKNNEDYFFRFPEELNNSTIANKLSVTHWSYFENWDPYKNYIIAKKYCGLEESKKNNLGTFTNFAQNDQALVALHTYLMYLKFGFGRATADACIEVRRGAMDRNQAISLIKLYDGKFPEEFLDLYLDYFKIKKNMFFDVLYKHSNKSLFERKKNNFIPKYNII
jgi:N-acetyl sugar amidotransferase